jgi:hypothetical protein
MSTEQSIDPELIEQTKQQIRGLVNEIAQLSKQDVSPEEFYGEFCSRVVSALAAVGGAIWVPGESGGLGLQYQINMRESKLGEDQQAQIRHGRLLHKAFTSGEPMLVPPHSGTEGDDEAGNPTDFLLVLAPLRSDDQVEGLVEVLQRPGARPTTQRGYLRFLMQMCELASDYLKSRRLRHYSDRQALWSQLEQFTRATHASLDPRETAYTIANEGRRLIECDRVSVAIKKGRKCYVEAISGQDTFDKRSNTVKLLNQLATAVVRTGDAVWYTGDTSDMAPQVEDAVQEYVDDSHSKTVAILPLKKRTVTGEEDEEHEDVLGALIVEQIEHSRPAEGMFHRVDVVCEHCSTALGNALEHQRLFLMPLWRFLGHSTWVLRARTLPKTIAVAVVLVGLIVSMFVVPWDFQLRAPGALQPVQRREVFTKIDGDIERLAEGVVHGAFVEADQPLVILSNTDLDVAEEKLIGDRKTAVEQAFNVESSLIQNAGKLTEEEHVRLQGQKMGYEQTIRNIDAQLALYEQKRRELTVTSPMSGEIVTWDIQETLSQGRPVQRGQMLLAVADLSGEWELEIKMPERRMGYITRAQKELEAQADENGNVPPLLVKYILATDPDTKHWGEVREIEKSAEVRGEEGNTVIIRVKIDKQDLLPIDPLTGQPVGRLRPGAAVDAKIHCGKRPLGFVLLHDLIDFVRSEILFRLF